MASLNDIFSWFQTGDLPTEAQFRATFSSFYHKDESIPMTRVQGLTSQLDQKLDAEFLQKHLTDENAHAATLIKKDGSNLSDADITALKKKLAILALATVDTQDGAGNVYTKDQIQQFITQLQERDNANFELIDGLIARLESDDLNLDELQEVVDFIKANQAQIEALQALAIGETTEDRVKLNSDYGFRRPLTQQDLNGWLMSYARARRSERHVISGSALINHQLGSSQLIVQVRDMLTGRRIECEDYVTGSTVQINFLQDLKNDAEVLVLKID